VTAGAGDMRDGAGDVRDVAAGEFPVQAAIPLSPTTATITRRATIRFAMLLLLSDCVRTPL
jgi:hypothetical protein